MNRGTAMRGIGAIGLFGSCITGAGADPTTIRFGQGATAGEQLWLLLAKPDMFGKNSALYKLEETRFTGSDKLMQAYEAGAIDLAVVGASGVLFAAAEGITAKIIASLSREGLRGFHTIFYARADSPIKTVADLKGKTIGINGFSTTSHLWLKAALAKVGLSDTDVTIVPIPFPAMGQSLEAGKIDVGSFPQPFAAMVERQMKVKKIFDSKYGVPFDEELIVIIGKDDFLKKNATAVRAFLKDLKGALQFYLEKPQEARQILIDSKIVRVDPDIYLKLQDWYRDPSMRPDVNALRQMQALQVKAGFQQKSIDVRTLVDTSYLPT